MFFESKPTCSTSDLVEEHFRDLLVFYREPFRSVATGSLLIPRPEFSAERLFDVCGIMAYALKVSLKIDPLFFSAGEERVRNLPVVLKHRFDESSQELSVSFSDWGKENYEVAFVELLLLLCEIKLRGTGRFVFEEMPDSSRRFLLSISAAFFGFGVFLLQRHEICFSLLRLDSSGEISELNAIYRVPVDLDTLIFATSLIACMNNSQTISEDLKQLNKSIRRTSKRWLRYIPNNSVLFADFRKGVFGKNSFAVLGRSISKYK